MPTTIQITAGKIKLKAELADTPTARAILKALPLKAKGNRWGGEIYFQIPVKAELEKENCRDILEKGELGYWPAGSAFCIFFGKTPASVGDEIRAASDVNVIGNINADIDELCNVPNGADIIIEKA